MTNYYLSCLSFVLGLYSLILSIVPENVFGRTFFSCITVDPEYIIIVNRMILLFGLVISVLIIGFFIRCLYLRWRNHIYIEGRTYSIEVKFGDLFKQTNCKRVITFDECFTTEIGEYNWQIKSGTICGQYLSTHSDLNIKALIRNSKIQPSITKSKYKGKVRYDSGKIVPNGDDLLMAFAKLTEEGIGFFSYEEYLACLSVMWNEIYKYSSNDDVCIPIVGAGRTTIDGISVTKQDLLDLIIESYKLCKNKIKLPNKLIIVCSDKDGISLNKIERCV